MVITWILVTLKGRSKTKIVHVNIQIRMNSEDISLRMLKIHREFYMRAHVLLNLLNELGKVIKCDAC